jgi:hypothetical protein
MVANRLEVPVVRAAFLLPMHWTLAGIHVEHDAVGAVVPLRLGEHITVHRHQADEILLAGQQLGFKPVQRRRERGAPVPDLRRPDQPKRGIGSEPISIVQVLVPGQPAIDRLPQQIGQAELGVQPRGANRSSVPR